MLALGLQASPRYNGNTNYLLTSFLNELEIKGIKTNMIEVGKLNIKACTGCNYCEENGNCHFKDDMNPMMYSLLREADIIVAATPIFFYSTTAQFKAFIDRTQTLWSRKYRKQLKDPGRGSRSGILLAQGATKGKNLFEGIMLTTKYFFDAVGAKFEGSLTYRQIENLGDMKKNEDLNQDIENILQDKLEGLIKRKKVLFACKENSCRSQMAYAYARNNAGKYIDVFSAGSQPASSINDNMVIVMEEKGFDMAYITPKSIDKLIEDNIPDYIITMGCGEQCPIIPGVKVYDWDVPDPAGKSLDFMREVRNTIENKVNDFLSELLINSA